MHRLLWIIILLSTLLAQADVFRPSKVLRDTREAMAARDWRRAASLADSIMRSSADPLVRLRTLQMLADIRRATGDYPAAEEAYDRAAAIMADTAVFPDAADPLTPDGRNLANLLLNRAQLEIALGRYGRAAGSLADAVFAPGSEGEIRREGALASLEYRLGNTSEALGILDEAIAEAGESPSLDVLLQNRAYILAVLGRHEEAIADYGRAMALLSDTGHGHGHVRANLAIALSGAGRHAEALMEIDRALKETGGVAASSVTTRRNPCSADEGADYLIALWKKAEILLRAGQRKESARLMRQSFEAERLRIARTLAGMPAQMRLDYWTMERPLLSRAFMIGDADPELLLDVALTRREISLPSLYDLGDEPDAAASRIMARGSDAARLLADGEAGVAFVLYPDEEGREMYGAVTFTSKGCPKFVPLFDAAFLDEPGMVADASISEAIEDEDPYLKNVLYSDSLLGGMIWRPVLESLPKSVRTVRFVPEGVFHLWGVENMPFAGGGDLKMVRLSSLLERPEDFVAGNSLIAGGLDYDSEPAAEGVAPGEGNNLAYMELTRGLGLTSPRAVFTYLPGTAGEAAEVARILGVDNPRDVLSEEEFKAEASAYSHLLLATHGYSLDCGVGAGRYLPSDTLAVDISLLRSGLALSGANVLGNPGSGSDGGPERPLRDDGILSAREICDLDLSGARLVVLSACQTAKGRITDENASGLVRALKMAGAGTIVATLWEVDDHAARLFMTGFHSRLAAGVPVSEAFSAAQSAVRDFAVEHPQRRFSAGSMSSRPVASSSSSPSSVSHPYAAPAYWAPFILIDP